MTRLGAILEHPDSQLNSGIPTLNYMIKMISNKVCSPHRAAAAAAAAGLLAPAALLELAVGRPAGSAAAGAAGSASVGAALDGGRAAPRRLAALGGLGVGVEDPPAGLAGALVLHAQEAAVQRQVVPDGVLQRREGERRLAKNQQGLNVTRGQ